LIHAVAASVLAIAVAGFLLRWYVARGWLVLTFILGVPAFMAEREVVRRVFARMRRRGRHLRPTVIIGGNTEGFALCELMMQSPELGYEVLGFIDHHAAVGEYLYDHRPVLASTEDAFGAVLKSGATSAIIATTAIDHDTTNRVARRLTDAGIHVELSSSLRDIDAGRLTLHSLGRFPVLYVEPVRRNGWRAVAKRTFDVTVSGVGLTLFAPLLFAVALLIKGGSRGPVFFKQHRVGRDGELFRMVKFRTMVHNAEAMRNELLAQNEASGPLFKIRNDPRVTAVGRVLRKLSLDEIPQLWNVLRGDMSLVGPRPALEEEMAGWPADYQARLRVRPGITGMWQVSGRSDVSFEEYTRLDLYYVDNWTLWADVAILAKTVPAVLLRRGAY
jgi:exopolysaccharide biosynthesis polyprenyl glycosylphosphotransferase